MTKSNQKTQTGRTLKPFAELSDSGKRARIKKYELKREELGTTENLAILVKPARIKDIKGGNKLATFRFAEIIKGQKEQRFFTASHFIKEGKEELETFLTSLDKGDLVSVEYKVENGYTNIYNLMDRRDSVDERKKAKAQESKPVMEQELEM